MITLVIYLKIIMHMAEIHFWKKKYFSRSSFFIAMFYELLFK